MDIAKRCEQNPLLAPKDLKAGINGMEITRQNLVTFARRRETYTERRNYQFSYIQ